MDSDVTTAKITMALQEKGFTVMTVFNILNTDRKQSLFKVEFAPKKNDPKKYEVHSIYNL